MKEINNYDLVINIDQWKKLKVWWGKNRTIAHHMVSVFVRNNHADDNCYYKNVDITKIIKEISIVSSIISDESYSVDSATLNKMLSDLHECRSRWINMIYRLLGTSMLVYSDGSKTDEMVAIVDELLEILMV